MSISKQNSSPYHRYSVRRLALAWGLLFILTQSGCWLSREQATRRIATIASLGPKDKVKVREIRESPLGVVGRYFSTRSEPSERTKLFLRKYSLLERYDEDPESVIGWLQELAQSQPSMEEIHALAEIAEIQGDWLVRRGDRNEATAMYAIAMIHAYQFLFDSKLDITRNAYDPQFRNICDIYNRSLERMLQEVCAKGSFAPGAVVKIGDEDAGFEFAVEVVGRWRDQEFERFEFVHDYRTEGIQNQYHTYGLGVPLIAVRKQQAINAPVEKYYPPELTMPMTAFCHFETDISADHSSGVRKAVLTLYDPLERTSIQQGAKVIPLESDITTPLAYHLRDPVLNTGLLATASLVNAELAPEIYGMYMLEPYNPDKIPVVMVHGFWSSPITWVRMFNDLRANKDIHENYQFWFYSYPSGQPFWLSARQMRIDLAEIRRQLDPQGDSKSLDQMVLVGHSMGGLVSTLQTIGSEQHFWEMVSKVPISEFKGEPKSLDLLRDTFFFDPNESVRKVITIATPFDGSNFANAATRWLSQKIFTLPQAETDELREIAKLNSDSLNNKEMLTTATSLDSLAPHAEVFKAIAAADVSNAVTFHNIVGKIPKRKFLASSTNDPVSLGDGVVSLESAHHFRAISEIAVPSEHSEVHQHSACIYEVRRILLEYLVEQDRIRVRNIPELPVDRAHTPQLTPNRQAVGLRTNHFGYNRSADHRSTESAETTAGSEDEKWSHQSATIDQRSDSAEIGRSSATVAQQPIINYFEGPQQPSSMSGEIWR